MERPNAWRRYDASDLAAVDEFAERYRRFISACKTERECVEEGIRLAREAGYASLEDAVAKGTPVRAGDKLYATSHNKALTLFHVGTHPISEGLNILGAHIDAPRIDVKQNPLYEKGGIAYLDTHYYGGIKPAQWVTMPLALHGVVARKDGSVVRVVVGEDTDDPVFCITDILPHLGAEQSAKSYGKALDAEMLDLVVGNRPATDGDEGGSAASAADTPGVAASGAANASESNIGGLGRKDEAVRAAVLGILAERYGIEEEDLVSAELEIVPAGPARDMGLDRSMILGYGHDDRSCAFPSLAAQLAVEAPERTVVTLLVDKEEIGSVGASGMDARYFENQVAELLALAGEEGSLALRRALARSRMLSSDVSAAYDPMFASLFEEKNSAYLGRGLCLNKYTGSRGKVGSSDADAEYVALVRDILDEAGVSFQTCELGRVDAGGGGTIAYLMARYGMDVIDAGVPVLSMHGTHEVLSKADLYEAYRGYLAFACRG